MPSSPVMSGRGSTSPFEMPAPPITTLSAMVVASATPRSAMAGSGRSELRSISSVVRVTVVAAVDSSDTADCAPEAKTVRFSMVMKALERTTMPLPAASRIVRTP